MCSHERLIYFKQHYRCRDCQEWWQYPHLRKTIDESLSRRPLQLQKQDSVM